MYMPVSVAVDVAEDVVCVMVGALLPPGGPLTTVRVTPLTITPVAQLTEAPLDTAVVYTRNESLRPDVQY